MHAASPLAKSPLISSIDISVATSQNDLQFIFTADGWRMYSFNLPLSAPACYWVPFRLSKHRLSNILSQHQSNSQAELSKPTREDFKISKRNRTRRLSEYIPIYQSSLQCGFYTHHLITRPVSKGGLRSHGKSFSSPEKMSWAKCMHNHCFRTCYRCIIWAFLRKFIAHLVSQAGYGSAGGCCLATSVSYATQFSLLTLKFFRFNIQF